MKKELALAYVIGEEYDSPLSNNIGILTPKGASMTADTPVMLLFADQPVPDGWVHQMDSRDIRQWLRSWEHLGRDRAIAECIRYIADLSASG